MQKIFNIVIKFQFQWRQRPKQGEIRLGKNRMEILRNLNICFIPQIYISYHSFTSYYIHLFLIMSISYSFYFLHLCFLIYLYLILPPRLKIFYSSPHICLTYLFKLLSGNFLEELSKISIDIFNPSLFRPSLLDPIKAPEGFLSY